MKINPNLFFLLREGNIIVWNYENHSQYILEASSFGDLIKISKNHPPKNSKILQGFLEAGLVKDLPAPNEQNLWGFDELSKIYHIGCRDLYPKESQFSPTEWIQEYLDFCSSLENPGRCLDLSGPKVVLPTPNFEKLKNFDLWSLMKERMTSRVFDGSSVSLEDFTILLYAGFGKTHENWDEFKELGLEQPGIRKAHPSGGGIHPLELFVFVMNIQGLEKGIYYYNWDKNYLIKLKDADLTFNLPYYLCDQFYTQGIACGLLITVNFSKVWGKYPHSRNYRNVFLDVGHASQTILLTATALKILTWETAAFRDSELSTLINVDGKVICPVFFIGLGNGEKSSIPSEIKEKLKN